jgi:acetolactate synthase-1/3 small subunit
MLRTIVATVSSGSNVLIRMTALMAKSAIRIESLHMQRSNTQENISRISMLLDVENERQTARYVNQLDRLVDVISVADMT